MYYKRDELNNQGEKIINTIDKNNGVTESVSRVGKRFSILGVCCIAVYLVFLTGCFHHKPPVPLKESSIKEIVIEEIKSNFEENAKLKFKLLKHNTKDTLDIVDFQIKADERTGLRGGFAEPLETAIESITKYTATFEYKEESWNLESLNQVGKAKCIPLESVDATRFVAYNYDDSEIQEHTTDLKKKIDKIVFYRKINTHLVDRQGSIVCNFKFSSKNKSWEWVDVKQLDDWSVSYDILGRWYLAENIADRKGIYLDIASVEDGVLTAIYKYRDEADIIQNVDIEWKGTAQKDNVFVFDSSEDDLELEILEEGKGDRIKFAGHIFKPY